MTSSYEPGHSTVVHQYIADIIPEGTIHGVTVRSRAPRGTITHIELPPLPPGTWAVRAQDIPGQDSLACLARERVSYVGEPVVLLGGPDPARLAELAERVRIEIEEETPILSLDQMERLEPVLTEQIRRGDAADALARASRIVEGEYRLASLEHLYPETQGAVAIWNGRTLQVHSATQDPFDLRERLASLLKLPLSRVRVLVPRLGNPLEGKLEQAALVAAHAALLSRVSGRPARIVYDRAEDLAFTSKSPAVRIRYRTGLDSQGKPVGGQVDILMDGGARLAGSSRMLLDAALAAGGGYRCENLEVNARLVLTHTVPAGSFRGGGLYPAFFAAEVHASRLAEVAQMDPYLWKKNHLLKTGDIRVGGGRLKGPVAAVRVLDEVASISDFRRKHAAYELLKKRRETPAEVGRLLRGIGLSVVYQGLESGGRKITVRCRLEADRRLTVLTSIVDMGQGARELLARIASRILDLDADRVQFHPVDTQLVPDSGPSSTRRTMVIAARLLERCCQAIQRDRLTATLPIDVRRSYLPAAASQDAAREDFSWAGTVVEVEVDPVTLQSRCRGIWVAVDAGQVPDRGLALLQVESAVLQAYGHAALDGGGLARHRPDHLSDYGLAGIPDVPPIEIRLLEREAAPGAGGFRGLGDLPFLGVGPAYATAVAQATGCYLDRFPMTPETLQSCLEAE